MSSWTTSLVAIVSGSLLIYHLYGFRGFIGEVYGVASIVLLVNGVFSLLIILSKSCQLLNPKGTKLISFITVLNSLSLLTSAIIILHLSNKPFEKWETSLNETVRTCTKESTNHLFLEKLQREYSCCGLNLDNKNHDCSELFKKATCKENPLTPRCTSILSHTIDHYATLAGGMTIIAAITEVIKNSVCVFCLFFSEEGEFPMAFTAISQYT